MKNRVDPKTLTHAVVIALSLSFVFAVVSEVAPVYAASVTQPILVATPSGGSAFAYTVSGCSVYPASGTSGSSSSLFAAAPSCVLKITMPSAETNTRYVFASSASSTTVGTCSSGTCATFSPSDYYQLSQTYTASSANAFPASSMVDLEGTQSGTFHTAACSISTGGTTSASCASGSSWFDYDAPVGFTSLSSQGTSTNQFSATPLTYGLVGYWPCNEAMTGNIVRAMDLSGDGMTATPVNSPTYTAGRFGGACDFAEANSQYLTIPYSSAMAVTTAMSWSSWVYLSSDTGRSMVMFYWNGVGGNSVITPYIGSSNLNFHVDFHWNDSTSTFYQDFTTPITIGKWYFVSVTYDGSSIRSYVGAAGGTLTAGTVTAATKTFVSSANGSTIGSAGSTEYWNGYLDDMRVYNRALSASEVAELYSGTPQNTIFTDTTGGNAHTVTYYDQFADSAQYTVSGGGSSTAPSLTGVSIGSTMNSFLFLTTSAQTAWLDASSSWSTTNPTTGSLSIEQWASSAASGRISGSAVAMINPTYMLTYNTPIIAVVTVAVVGSVAAAVFVFRRYFAFTWRQ